MTRILRCVLLIGVACGGAPETVETRPAGRDARAGARATADSARQALDRGQLEVAAGLAAEAIAQDSEDERVLAAYAAIALARGQDRDVVEALETATDSDLVHLRAKARFRLGDAPGVVRDLESFADDERDGWMEVVLAIARGAGSDPWWSVGGDDRATLAMVSGPPVPVVEIAIDGASVRALVSTATDLTVVDDRLADDPKLLGRVELGPIAIERVPAMVRDLDPIERQLGTPIGAVIGLDLLRHFETTIDFRERWLVVRRDGTEAGDGSSARYATLSGSFLAVYAALDGAEGWLVVDSAGLFPIALSPAAVTALGLDLDSLEAPPSAPAPDVRLTAIEALRIGEFELRGVPAVTGLVPRDLDALAGAPLAGMLGAVVFNERKLVITPASRRIYVE